MADAGRLLSPEVCVLINFKNADFQRGKANALRRGLPEAFK
jgi:hypothetical protein